SAWRGAQGDRERGAIQQQPRRKRAPHGEAPFDPHPRENPSSSNRSSEIRGAARTSSNRSTAERSRRTRANQAGASKRQNPGSSRNKQQHIHQHRETGG